MAYSYTDHGSKGVGDTMTVGFPFDSRDHVSVLVDGVVVSTSLWEWLNDGLLQCKTGFPSGTVTRVQRTTPSNSTAGELVGATSLDYPVVNRNTKRLLYLQQESRDAEDSREARIVEMEEAFDTVDEAAASAAASAASALSSKNATETLKTTVEGHATTVAADKAIVAADKATVAADKNTVATDKGHVSADKNTVAADKAIVASDKNTVASFAAAVATDRTAVGADKNTVATDKGIVAADKAIVAADKATTQGYRDQAAISAASINLPSIVGQGGKFLRARGDETGYDFLSQSELQWLTQPIGVPIPVWSHLFPTIADALPPTDSGLFRYVLLTAGEDGLGEYNEGVLTSESVSGSAPLLTATAVISMVSSPLNGGTVSLINTERRFIRAGETGVVQADAMQGHFHTRQYANTVDFNTSAGSFDAGAGYGTIASRDNVGSPSSDGVNGTPRTANETRGKNIGATFIMRIY